MYENLVTIWSIFCIGLFTNLGVVTVSKIKISKIGTGTKNSKIKELDYKGVES